MKTRSRTADPDPRPLRDEHAFLGEEFLTWLWWRAESGRGEYELDGKQVVGIALDAPLVLRSGNEDEEGRREEQVLRNGRPLGGPEAAAALRRGKKLARARIVVARAGREWTGTLDGESMSLRSVAVPTGEESDEASPTLDHLAAFEEIADVLDGVYAQFLEERLAPAFRDGGLRALRAWVSAK